ncbi:MAG TPA: glycoside hydrolase family 2 TIM barrel-domain containing protein [Roseiflexaceae bacterium]|jgi:beta-mannosidase|nr:glycoside hydrolase family 2 TIM barrel-domain containing protein [Roseiflexaceae bacterium]
MTIVRSLNGPWQLLPVDAFRQGFYPRDDRAWVEQQLPAHWQQHALFERYSGKMVYRKAFSLDERVPDGQSPRRHWLRFNGVFYWMQAYFNGVDLGRDEGYFVPHEYEVTDWLHAENTLVVEVDCPEEHNKFGKRMITGVFSHWDCIDPATNPGGMWLPVELISTGAVRIKTVQLQTERASSALAEIRFRTTVDSTTARDVTLRWTLEPKNFAGQVQVIEMRRALAAGEQEIAGLFNVSDPQLWWTHDLGHPNCYTVRLEVVDNDTVSDDYTCTFGIRTFTFENWIARLNGKRLFIKGSNYAPGDVRIATMTFEQFVCDIELAQQCHMNMLRVHAHVEHPDFYEAANLAGVLLWQDFPMQWLYRRSVLPEAERQARQMVRLLYNHPSLVVWCMHNEPLYNADTRDERITTVLRTYFSVFVWNWNRDVLDTHLKHVAESEDATRSVVRSSGEYAIPLLHKGTDTHFYFGWYAVYGPLWFFSRLAHRFPKNVRFVTEFGAQSFPNYESTIKFVSEDISQIDWNHLIDRHLFQENMLAHWLDWKAAESLQELIDMTQEYQSSINRFYIDRLRYHKYRPTGGIVPFMFHDPNPAVLWSVVDYWRVPKRSYYALRDAFSPQYMFTLLEHEQVALGDTVDLPIYIVNDAHEAVPVELEMQLRGPDGEELASFAKPLTLPADCMAMEIERLRLSPDQLGTYCLVLVLRNLQGGELENVYRIVVGERGSVGEYSSLRSHPMIVRRDRERLAR